MRDFLEVMCIDIGATLKNLKEKIIIKKPLNGGSFFNNLVSLKLSQSTIFTRYSKVIVYDSHKYSFSRLIVDISLAPLVDDRAPGVDVMLNQMLMSVGMSNQYHYSSRPCALSSAEGAK